MSENSTESTVSATIKLTTEKGGDILLTVRAGANAGEVKEVLTTMVTALKWAANELHITAKTNGVKVHATNGNGHAQPAQAAPPQAQAYTDDNPPVCNLHNKPMKPSQYGGWYCTSKLADGSYCNEKVKP